MDKSPWYALSVCGVFLRRRQQQPKEPSPRLEIALIIPAPLGQIESHALGDSWSEITPRVALLRENEKLNESDEEVIIFAWHFISQRLFYVTSPLGSIK